MITSNEFLVERIRAGEEKFISDLWLQVKGFIASEARKQLASYPEYYQGKETGLEDDMISEAFFAFYRAILDYDVTKSKFITYLSYKIRPSFNRVLSNYTDNKKPLNSAISLDVPLNDEEDIYLSDTISDIAADNDLKKLENTGRRIAVGELLRSVLDEINNPVGVAIMSRMYTDNCSFPEAVRRLYDVKTPSASHKNSYIQVISQIKRKLRLRRYVEKVEYYGLDEYISFTGCGLGAFNSHNFTSIVESDVIRKISKEERFLKSVCG